MMVLVYERCCPNLSLAYDLTLLYEIKLNVRLGTCRYMNHCITRGAVSNLSLAYDLTLLYEIKLNVRLGTCR